ncbi:MAG: hypothetical protein U9Q33_07335 [Campylobacterota bacterium]|nr:hypothetical protein [Campylobacterota bacterium]
MTRKQQEFYRILANQIVDYSEDFHKEFMVKRIEQIPDDKLKYLLEDINVDKDKIIKKKGYITYAKFIYYADKMIENSIENIMLPKISKVEELYNKRAVLLKTIEDQTNSIHEKNNLIEDIKNKVMMFKDNDKNILDECDYYIINKFGFYQFFDENRNYHIKEDIEKYFKEYLSNKMLLDNSKSRKLINS